MLLLREMWSIGLAYAVGVAAGVVFPAAIQSILAVVQCVAALLVIRIFVVKRWGAIADLTGSSPGARRTRPH